MNAPLSALKILDFSTLIPGPFATMMLADLGAEVLRVEAPTRPDLGRAMPPFDDGVSTLHSTLNRNKRAIAIDLKQPGGPAIVKRLVQTYDIVIEQFRPGVMDRLGIGYKALQAENQALIYCAITGYGQTGPYRDRPGHDMNFLALAGIAELSRRKGEAPTPPAVQIADVGGGSYNALVGILAAVVQRGQTGQGAFIDISMFDGSLAWNTLAMSQQQVGDSPQPEGMLLNGGAFYDYYATKDGRYLSIAPLEPKFWAGFCQAIQRPDLLNQGLSAGDQAALKAEIGATLRQRTLAEWQAIFEPLPICVEPVLTMANVAEHSHVQAREMLVTVPKETGGWQRQVGLPIKLNDYQPEYRHTGVALGAHTDEILREAGYGVDEIAAFRMSKTIS